MGQNYVSGLLLAIVLAIVVPQHGVCVQRFALTNDGLYTFQNVADLGFLTNPLGSDLVVTAPWQDIPGQKWQVSKAYVYTSYLVKPLTEGMGARYSMEAVKGNDGVMRVKKVGYTLGLANDLYWSVIPAEGNFYMIQNLDNDLCLETIQLGAPVILTTCRMAKTQQWAIHARPKY